MGVPRVKRVALDTTRIEKLELAIESLCDQPFIDSRRQIRHWRDCRRGRH
jgi:hypothetical protein